MNNQASVAIKNAKDVLNRLAIILKISQTYSAGNQAVVRAVDAFAAAVGQVMLFEKSLNIELLGEYFYLNGGRIRYSVQYYLNFDFLINEFRKRGLGSIMLSENVSRDDLQEFIKGFQSCLTTEAPYVYLKGSIETIDSIDITPLKQARQDRTHNSRQMLRRNYFNAVFQFKTLTGRAARHENIELKKARFSVNSLIDVMLQEEQMALSMTAIKDFDEYTFHHSVNVSILSIALGMKLGLNKKRLSELGIAAFLHDIGKVSIPDEILNKTTPFTDREWELVRLHPVEGVKSILGSMRIDHVTVKSAIVSYAHHLNLDGSGYPRTKYRSKSNLYTKIVTIADRFDAMTSAKVYSRVPKPPEAALRILVENAGSQVDPILLKIFIKMMGLYPIGTLVSLDTRELGIVYRGNPAYPDRPSIVLISDSEGHKIENTLADLTERGLDGSFRRTVKKTLDYNKYNISLAEYLLDAY